MAYTLEKHNVKLDSLIQQAVKKIGGTKEKDICRYLPGESGKYYAHHFTIDKLKTEDPERLEFLINEHIMYPSNPQQLPPKPRAARGSRKRRDQPQLSRQDVDQLLGLVRAAGNKDLLRKLIPRKDIRAIKRELIVSIRHGRIEPDLWQSYVEAMTNQSNVFANANGNNVPALHA
jgi:hypothetical protein